MATPPSPRPEPVSHASHTFSHSIGQRRHSCQYWAMPVLDTKTGQFLEYRQLCKHPSFSELWRRSYSIEMKCLCLCQGIGRCSNGNGQEHVKDAYTFHFIKYVTYRVPTTRASSSTAITSAAPETLARPPDPLISSNSWSTVSSPRQAPNLHASTLPHSVSKLHWTAPNRSTSNLLASLKSSLTNIISMP